MVTIKQRKVFLARVKAGIAYLNVLKPNWVKKINLKKFTIDSTKSCVLGQAFGGYVMGLNKLDFSDEQAETLGFYDGGFQYDILQHVWFKELKKLGAK